VGNASAPNSSTLQPFNSSTTNTYPLSIFPESEQRRIAADFGQPRVPVAVKRAITGAEKAMARPPSGPRPKPRTTALVGARLRRARPRAATRGAAETPPTPAATYAILRIWLYLKTTKIHGEAEYARRAMCAIHTWRVLYSCFSKALGRASDRTWI